MPKIQINVPPVPREVIELAAEQLPPPGKYLKRVRNGNTFATLKHEDHGLEYYDKIQIYFKAVVDQSSADPENVSVAWTYVTTKIRTLTDAAPAALAESIPTLEKEGAKIPATRGALRLMQQYNIVPEDIRRGSGLNGKILKSDVVEYIREELELEVTEVVGDKPKRKASKKKDETAS